MEDIKDKATELTEEELKDVDGAGCGCEDVPVLKEELTEEELKGVDGGSAALAAVEQHRRDAARR